MAAITPPERALDRVGVHVPTAAVPVHVDRPKDVPLAIGLEEVVNIFDLLNDFFASSKVHIAETLAVELGDLLRGTANVPPPITKQESVFAVRVFTPGLSLHEREHVGKTGEGLWHTAEFDDDRAVSRATQQFVTRQLDFSDRIFDCTAEPRQEVVAETADLHLGFTAGVDHKFLGDNKRVGGG